MTFDFTMRSVRNAMLLAAIGLLTACVDEVMLPYDGASISLEATPVKGKGLQLVAQVQNQELKVSSCGFRMINDANHTLYPGRPYVEDPTTCNVELNGSTTFSTILEPTEEWMTQFKGYAYIIVQGHEYRSSQISVELGSEDFERHVPQVEAVICHNLHTRDGRVSGKLELRGQGFYGWGGRDGYPSYIQLLTDGGDFQFDYGQYDMKVSPTHIELPFTAGIFDTFTLTSIRQGGVDYAVNRPIDLMPADHLVAPSYGLRLGEPLNLHQTLRMDSYYQVVNSLQSDDALCASFFNDTNNFEPLFGFISDKDRITCRQYMDKCPLAEPLELDMSYPWEPVGHIDQSSALPADRVMTAGAVWYLLDGVLNRLDPATYKVTTYALPFTAGQNEVVRIGKDDRGGLLLCRNCNSKSGKDYLYNFDPDKGVFEAMGTVSPASYFDSSLWKLLFIGQEGDKVCMVHRITDWSFCCTRYDATKQKAEARYYAHPQHPDFDVKALYKGKLYMICGYGDLRYLYSASTDDTFGSVELVRMPILPRNFDYDFDYTPDYMTQSGHYLYSGNAPVARFDLDDENYRLEYLGAPRGAYYSLDVLYLDGDECQAIDSRSGDVYRFVEDRF